MMDEPHDLDSLVEFTQYAVDQMVAMVLVKPDDDLRPFATFVSETRGAGLAPLDEFMDGHPLGVPFVGYIVLPKLIEEVDATCFGIVCMAYKAETNGEEYTAWRDANPDASLSEFPGSVEAINLMFGDRDGVVATVHRDVHRNENEPPTVSPWSELVYGEWKASGAGEYGMEGRMIDSAMSAITGRPLITREMFVQPAAVLSSNPQLTQRLVEALEAQGFDEETFGRMMEDNDPRVLEAVASLPDDFKEIVQTTIEEHMPEYGEFMFEQELLRAAKEHQEQTKLVNRIKRRLRWRS